MITATFITLTLISGVLFLVLAKPRLDITKLVPASLFCFSGVFWLSAC